MMKNIFLKYVKIAGVMLIALCLVTMQTASAQKTKTDKATMIKTMIDSQHYVMLTTYATPMSGRQRYLTTPYTLKVSKDTIDCDLPYFGRAYSAPLDMTGGGIRFTSTKFDYTSTPRKKGGWNIVIQPKDVQQSYRLSLTVFENGSSSLQVTSNNRQPISFSGDIKKAGT